MATSIPISYVRIKNAAHLASVGNAIQKTDLTKKDVLFLDDSS